MPFFRLSSPQPPQSVPVLTAGQLDFRAFWRASTALLEPQPGRGILLSDPESPGLRELLFMEGDSISICRLDDRGRISVVETGCIDPRTWEFEGCSWLADQFNAPQWVEILLEPHGDVDALTFIHEGTEVQIIALSQCRLSGASPDVYGFSQRGQFWYREVPAGTLALGSQQLILMDEHGEVVAVHDLAASPPTAG